MIRTSSYMRATFEDRADFVNDTVDALRERREEFDAIAVTGVSGMLIGCAVAHILNVPIIIVRKSGETTHADARVEAECTKGRYIIVDDFVASGATVKTIKAKVLDACPDLDLRAVYCYRHKSNWDVEDVFEEIQADNWNDARSPSRWSAEKSEDQKHVAANDAAGGGNLGRILGTLQSVVFRGEPIRPGGWGFAGAGPATAPAT